MHFIETDDTYQKDVAGYFFGNMYLSQIQQGIQAEHVSQSMCSKYGREEHTTEGMLYYDWVDRAKTVQLFNGGMQDRLEKIYSILEVACPVLYIPFGKFHEENRALNGALTSVGFVAKPEHFEYDPIYDLDQYRLNRIKIRPGTKLPYTEQGVRNAKFLLGIVMHKARYA